MWINFLLGLYVVGVLVVLAALFVPRPRVRLAAVIAGAIVIWLPYVTMRASLGVPSPYTVPGNYQLIGRKMNRLIERVYLLVDDYDGKVNPKLYSIHFVPGETTKEIDLNQHPYRTMDIELEEQGGGLKLNEKEWILNDPNKDRYYAVNPVAERPGATDPGRAENATPWVDSRRPR